MRWRARCQQNTTNVTRYILFVLAMQGHTAAPQKICTQKAAPQHVWEAQKLDVGGKEGPGLGTKTNLGGKTARYVKRRSMVLARHGWTW